MQWSIEKRNFLLYEPLFQPSSYVDGLKEETISIKFSVTVPVGCLNVKRQYLCKTNIYILTPEYKPSTPSSSCQNFSGQGDVSFDENGCGIVIESSTWWEEKVLNVTGNTDGLINMKDRDMYIKLGSLRDGAEDISGVWYNFSMPNIQVCANLQDMNNTMSIQRTLFTSLIMDDTNAIISQKYI